MIYASASTGIDTNPGTISAPVQSISRAQALMKLNGDNTLLIKAGDVWTKDCFKVTANGQVIGPYGDGAAPTIGAGCSHGVDVEGFNNWTVGAIHITGTTSEGLYAISTKDGTNLNGTINGTIIDQTGWSGILVRNRNAANAAPVTGLKISNVQIGAVNVKAGLNYNLAGIQLMGVTGAVVTGGSGHINTGTQMAVQDRSYGAATCGGNTFTKLNIYGNEGGISAICPNATVSYSHVYNGKGFGIQVGPGGRAYSNKINDLVTSTDGKLYNGIDGNGGTNAAYSNNTIYNVAGCLITVEGAATGVKISGGSMDATAGGQCALYITANSMPVTFDGTTVWKSTGKAFKVGGLAYANMMTQAQFTGK